MRYYLKYVTQQMTYRGKQKIEDFQILEMGIWGPYGPYIGQ